MNIFHWKRACLRGALAIAMLAGYAQAQNNRPNVVFILADNVGYGDLGPYGGGELRGYPTPRIDELARQGLRLTQFLVEPTCTPSRAALMTGQYSIRSGLSLISPPGSPNQLTAKSYTMGSCSRVRATRRLSSGSGISVQTRRPCPPRTALMSSMASRRTHHGTTR